MAADAKGQQTRLSELRIVLLGKQGAGKSTAGNAILGKEFNSDGQTCVKRKAEVAGRQVTVIDTPGWDRVSVQRTPEAVKKEILRSVFLCPPGPHALILVLPVNEFSGREKRSVKKHLDLLHERAWRHTLVLFVCDDELRGTTIQSHIEKSGGVLQGLLQQCGNRYHVLSHTPHCSRTQVTELLEKVEEMVADNCGDFYIPQVYYELILSKTPSDTLALKETYERREEQLKQRHKVREEELKKQLEDWSRNENELEEGMRKRRNSTDTDRPNFMGDRQDEQNPEQRQRVDLEAIRMGYREEAMVLLKNYIKPGLVVLIAVFGALLGSIGGAQYGTTGSAIGIPVGIVVALLMTCLVRGEARAARGISTSIHVDAKQGPEIECSQPPHIIGGREH